MSLGRLESDNQRFELRIRLARAAGVPVLTVARTGGASQSEHESWIEDTTVQYGLVTTVELSSRDDFLKILGNME